MRRIAIVLGVLLLVAGCGGGNKRAAEPTTALLTNVNAGANDVTFTFKSQPENVKASYTPLSQIAESGSGAHVKISAPAAVVVHFTPAATADLNGEKVVPTYTGPKRLEGTGPVRDVVKISDFEADLGWAIGVDSKLPLHVSRDGSRVTITFG
jgi:hypothetical protein